MSRYMEKPDVVVIGGGVAGLSAATWLGRHRIPTVVVDSGEYRNKWVEKAHGYLGMDAISPAELLEKARMDLKRYGSVTIRKSTVNKIKVFGGGFEVEVPEGPISCGRIILATGVVDAFPQVEGFFDYYGKSIFHCPMCDGYETQGKSVAVIGWSREAAALAATISNWAANATLVTDGEHLRTSPKDEEDLAKLGVEIVTGEASALEGENGELSGLRLESGELVECQMAFFSIGNSPAPELPDMLGLERTDEGSVAVDSNGETSVKGVYAAGDMTP
ncbi:MAG TPA: NAD(P)/FAD-dependent oxidoreductase, partial [Actinomycetota bacterium]|nr:NAD(P)/FAD-dependent oxidoreductase [Actinomycetota bacterium]